MSDTDLLQPGRQLSDSLFALYSRRPEWIDPFARELLPPRARSRLSGRKLQLSTTDFVDDKELRRYFADRLLVGEIRDPATGAMREIFVLIEHKATRGAEAEAQQLRYKLQLLRWYAQEHPDRPRPMLFQVAVYQGRENWHRSNCAVSDLQRMDLLLEEPDAYWYRLLDLARLLQSGELDALAPNRPTYAVLATLAWRRADGAGVMERIRESTEPRSDLEATILCYILNAKEGLDDVFLEDTWYGPRPHLKKEGVVPTYIETKQAEAQTEARKAMLLEQVQERFGEIAEDARRTIEGGTEKQVKVWTYAVLQAKSIHELLGAPDAD